MKVYVLVTRLKPDVDGVGDYALNLAKQMRQDFEVDSHFIVCDSRWKGKSLIEGFQVTRVASRSSKILKRLLVQYTKQDSTVILHYVPHGYAKKACPFWLIKALAEWRSLSDENHLVTMFHELYATLTVPWDTDFWLWPIQRNLYVKLAKLSDSCITSSNIYGKMIDSNRRKTQSTSLVLQVPSSMGEPKSILPLELKEPRAVIFGQQGSKLKVYRRLEKVAEGLQQLGIQEIYDIGPPAGEHMSKVADIPVRLLGKQRDDEISKVLRSSLLGLISYQPQRMSKSSIFASYTAHGLPCLNLSREKPSVGDGLLEGQHYLTLKQLNRINLGNLQPIAENSYSWYQNHNLSRQAQVFYEQLYITAPLSNC